MRCPFCHSPDSRVVDSRETDEGATTRRRRSCPVCGRRFTTVEEPVLAVVKRSGVSEPFDRNKVIAGVRRACQGRPVDEGQLAGDSTVVVRSGDTLWSIARDVAPEEDPRAVVDAIVELNGLHDVDLLPGAELQLP